MNTNKESNLFHLEMVVHGLGDLLPQVTFVGGCTTLLLVDKAAHFGVRKTDDVDVVVDIATLTEYHRFGRQLKKSGFKEDVDGPNCRWILKNNLGQVKLDVVPVNKNILGFSNRWYPDAIRGANRIKLASGKEIQVISAAYFIATKFEAFADRGKGNYFSHDLEDIVFVMENRRDFILELSNCSAELKTYFSEQARLLLNDEFLNVLPGLLNNPDSSKIIENNLKIMRGWLI